MGFVEMGKGMYRSILAVSTRVTIPTGVCQENAGEFSYLLDHLVGVGYWTGQCCSPQPELDWIRRRDLDP